MRKHDTYLANHVAVSLEEHGLCWKTHLDPHNNTSVTDSRVGLYFKMLIEHNLRWNKETYGSFKIREGGPDYMQRDHALIVSAADLDDAEAVGRSAVDCVMTGTADVMVTLKEKVAETGHVPLCEVANPGRGSKFLIKDIHSLGEILIEDGMMVSGDVFMENMGEYIDLNGPNRAEIFQKDGFRFPVRLPHWNLIEKKLPQYQRAGL